MSKRSSRKPSKATQLLKGITHLTFIGIGFGVITGSVLNTIALHQKGEQQSIFPSWLSFKEKPLSSILGLTTNKLSREEKKGLNLGISFRSKEITSLSQRWEELANEAKDLQVSAFLLSLDDQKYAQLAPSKILPAASAIKIPILLATLKMVNSGQIRWDEELQLNETAIGGGSGWMAYQPLGKRFPLHEVAHEMIRVSDNTATNLLIQRIGGIPILNQQFQAFGLPSTEIKNLLPDLEGTNTTSAKDLVRTLAMVDEGRILNPRTRDLFREVMATSETNRLLPGGLLKGLGLKVLGGKKENIDYSLQIHGYRVYNKTGDIGIAYADAGLIQMPNNTRAVAGLIVKRTYNDPRSALLIRKMPAPMEPSIPHTRQIQSEDKDL